MKAFLSLFMFIIINVTSLGEIKIGLNNTNPAVKQHIVLTVEFLEEKKLEYEIEGIEKFNIISMGSRSNYTSINKHVQYSRSDVYTLCPIKEGQAVLRIKAKNGSQSNKIVVNISKKPVENKDDKFILEITPYTRDYYMGEKIPFVERVVIKTQVNDYSYVSPPVFNGFSIKNVTPRDSRGFPIPKRVINDGKENIELVLFRSILEPVSAGNKIVRSGGIGITEQSENGKEGTPVYLGFKEFNLNILPLPKKDKPADFHGVVGQLKGDYIWSKDIIEGKNALVLKLRLYGDVNLDKLEEIIFPENKYSLEYDIFEKVISSKERVLNSVYTAEKEYEIVFFSKDGSLAEPFDISISYFDPIDKEYKNFIIKKDKVSDEKSKEHFYNNDNVKEISFVPMNEIEIDNFNSKNYGKIKSEPLKQKIENRDKKDIIIIILIGIIIIEGAYIIINRKK